MTRPRTLVKLAILVAVVATAVGLVVSNAPGGTRVGGAFLGLLLYGSLAWWSRHRPRVVAAIVAALSAVGAAANFVSPNAAQLLVGLLSVGSACLALAALRWVPSMRD